MNRTVDGSRSRALRWALAVMTVVASMAALTGPAQAEDVPKVSVMTRNVYLGGDLTPSIVAPTLPAFLGANAALLSHVDAVNFPARAVLLAREIVEHKP